MTIATPEHVRASSPLLPELSFELPDADDGDLPIRQRGRDILIVDDHHANTRAIEASLASLGRNLVFVRSGLDALAQLRERDFALVVLDVAAPGMDGFETAALVRARERGRPTPILLVTSVTSAGWHDDDAVLRGFQLGAFDVLASPVRPEILRAKARVFVQLQERALALHDKTEELRHAEAMHQRVLLEQRRRFEAEALERQIQQLAETNQRKDEFLAILSHELRNPLQPLQTAVEVLEHDASAPVPARIRQIIQRQVHHITRLVDDLLDISRFNRGRFELRREPVDLDEIVAGAVQVCRPLIDDRRHHLELIGPRPAATVFGDPVRLVQVVSNVVNNAAKYTNPEGRIRVEWGTNGGMGFVRVTDNGKGIAPDLLPTIFEMFVQQRTTPDGAGGLGLGLGLVKRLVEMHGGSVHATSAGVDRGSEFEIRLALADEHLLAKLARSRKRSTSDDRPLRAVVCDDAPDLRELVADLLRLHGHEVTVVEDGPTAVQVICRDKPDVALIDIGLPDMDGYEVAREIRRKLTDAYPRLIAMTGYGQASDRAAAFEAGFDAHIVKPASADKILRALRESPDDDPGYSG